MGARPMARVIQEYIKKPLADEVLFGSSKSGGHVRVIVVKDDTGDTTLSFDYPDGPVTPRPEKLPEPRRAKAKRRSSPRRSRRAAGGGGTPPRRGTVPKVPLVKARRSFEQSGRLTRPASRAATVSANQIASTGSAAAVPRNSGTAPQRSMTSAPAATPTVCPI